ncbi:MAG: tetratricopeptide repeat protein, partial [Planctomycetota bacterium]
EDPSKPLPIDEGEGEAQVTGEIRIEEADLRISAVYVRGEEKIRREVRGPLDPPERNRLLFRELSLRILTALRPADPELCVRLGVVLREEGLVEKALEAYGKAITLRPTFAAAHFNMGIALDALGDIQGAIRAFRKAVEADPRHIPAKYSWALDEMRPREEKESRQAFHERISRAEGLFGEILVLAPRRREVRYLRIQALEILGKYSEALEECNRTKQVFPGESRTYEVCGHLHLALKRYAEALGEFRRLEEMEPRLVTNAYFLGCALAGLGREKEAAEQFQAFLDRSGDDPKFAEARENALRRMKALQIPGEEEGEREEEDKKDGD